MKVIFNVILSIFFVKLFTFIRLPQQYVEEQTYFAIKFDPFSENIIRFYNDIPLHIKLFSNDNGLGFWGNILIGIYSIPWYLYVLVLIILFILLLYKRHFH